MLDKIHHSVTSCANFMAHLKTAGSNLKIFSIGRIHPHGAQVSSVEMAIFSVSENNPDKCAHSSHNMMPRRSGKTLHRTGDFGQRRLFWTLCVGKKMTKKSTCLIISYMSRLMRIVSLVVGSQNLLPVSWYRSHDY